MKKIKDESIGSARGYDNSGRSKIYYFRLVYSNGLPSYKEVERASVVRNSDPVIGVGIPSQGSVEKPKLR